MIDEGDVAKGTLQITEKDGSVIQYAVTRAMLELLRRNIDQKLRDFPTR